MKLAAQAIIMAGGEGVRLRPLTMDLPKPLVPLLGEPVMGYALRLLTRHGITDVGATLWYQPRKIRAHFGKGDAWGVKMRYYEETAPLGTAGSVRMAREHLKGTFLVLSGDGLTDCDLTAALAFHREKQALATLVLKRVNIPLPYGVVMTDRESRITRFIEKPAWSRVFSDLVNTGLYILEPEIFDYIPAAGAQDFGRDIFPALLAGGLPLYGYETDGYWCDVGDQQAYLEAQRDLLEGRVDLPHAGGIHESAHIDPAARIEGACHIGRGAVIGPGAVVSRSVIGENCVIGPGAAVENACLWDRASVQKKAQVRGCVLCDGAVARQEALIPEGCALGQGAVAGAHAQLRPGVKVWPHLKVMAGATADRPIVSGDFTLPPWSGRGVDCDTPETVCALCAAYAKAAGARQVITARDDAQALQSIASGALGAAGVRVLSAGEMTAPMMRTMVRALRLDGGVFAEGQTLRFLNRWGDPVSAKVRTAMEGCILRQDAPPAFSRPGSVIRLTGAEDIYLARVLPEDAGRPLFSPVAVFTDSGLLRRLAREGLGRMEARDVRCGEMGEGALRPQETGFFLSARGEEWTVRTDTCTPSPEQRTMLLLSLFYRQYGKIFDLSGVPRAAEQIAPLSAADQSEACAWQQTLLQDGLAAVFFLCGALKQGPLQDFLAGLPETHILTRDVACSMKDKGRILHTLCDRTLLPHTLGDGVRIRHDRGFATIVPDAHRGMVRVVSESGDSEFARELCDFYLEQIRGIAQEGNRGRNMP